MTPYRLTSFYSCHLAREVWAKSHSIAGAALESEVRIVKIFKFLKEKMGTKFNFVCPGCGYASGLVSGGRDMGMIAVVRTMVCEDCDSVVDVLIGRYGKDGSTGDPDYDKNLHICPECKGTHLHPWPREHPCPKCNANMIKDENGMVLWD